MTQTRNPNELAGWITSLVGTSNSGATPSAASAACSAAIEPPGQTPVMDQSIGS